MTQASLEERVAILEKSVSDLIASLAGPNVRKDWRSTVGMFAGDPVMKEIIAEGRRIREADRRQLEE